MPRWFFHPLTAFLVTLVALVAVISLQRTVQKTRLSSENTRVLEQEVAKIASEISSLEKQALQAEHSITQEKIIRDELLLQKPGETIVQLPAVSPRPLPSPSLIPTLTPWQEWQLKLLQ